jgi:hypothetical protein
MKLDVELEKNAVRIISAENEIRICIYSEEETPVVEHPGIGILILKDRVENIFIVESGLDIKGRHWDRLILTTVPANLELTYVLRGFVNHALENQVELPAHFKNEPIPANLLTVVTQFVQQQLFVINHFGVDHLLSAVPAKKPAKVQHRWHQAISTVPFYIKTADCQAEVWWTKRNAMVIKAGATMKKEPTLNRDGSLGFSAKMGQKIRSDHQDAFQNGVTITDITLKSVNEVSLFLCFGGMNSWLVLKDQTGKTIDEWSRS